MEASVRYRITDLTWAGTVVGLRAIPPRQGRLVDPHSLARFAMSRHEHASQIVHDRLSEFTVNCGSRRLTTDAPRIHGSVANWTSTVSGVLGYATRRRAVTELSDTLAAPGVLGQHERLISEVVAYSRSCALVLTSCSSRTTVGSFSPVLIRNLSRQQR